MTDLGKTRKGLKDLAAEYGIPRRTLEKYTRLPVEDEMHLPSEKMPGKRWVCVREFEAWLAMFREKPDPETAQMCEELMRGLR